MPLDPKDAKATLYHFHGTRAALRAGGQLLPRAVHHGAPTTAPLTAGGQRLPESDGFVYVTNLSLDLATSFGLPQAVDSQWAGQVTRHTIARLPAHIPPIRGGMLGEVLPSQQPDL